MDLILDYTNSTSFNKKIILPGSKSESNRLLILQKIFPNLVIKNLANADDTMLLKKGLEATQKIINIGHAGTTMRFLTALFATTPNINLILTGSSRMQKRPIKILVDALQQLGATISYENEVGFPPLHIQGSCIKKNEVVIDGHVSSQYISALLLIAPTLKNGLKIILKGEVTSKPYITMTVSLLNKIGVKTQWVNDSIMIFHKKKIEEKIITVESDWSAVSYYYSLVALSKNGKLRLSYFKENSLQGDKNLIEIYKELGVKTTFKKDGILIEKITNFKQKTHLIVDLINTPDIAQTLAVTCFGLGISCGLTGLHTLKIKETDRLEALKTELKKMGAKIRVTNDSLHLKSNEKSFNKNSVNIDTYNDHRMAMAFAPLSILFPININDADVVSKSYPNFWNDFRQVLIP